MYIYMYIHKHVYNYILAWTCMYTHSNCECIKQCPVLHGGPRRAWAVVHCTHTETPGL